MKYLQKIRDLPLWAKIGGVVVFILVVLTLSTNEAPGHDHDDDVFNGRDCEMTEACIPPHEPTNPADDDTSDPPVGDCDGCVISDRDEDRPTGPGDQDE